MGIGDFFHFDESEFAHELKRWSLSKLRTQEVVRTRQIISSGATIGGGLGAAPFTFGLSLLGSAYGGRRLYVVKKKLELIQAELADRNIELYEPSGKDFLIGFLPSVAAMGLGVGVDALASHATSTVAAHVVADHGSRALNEAIQSPGTLAHGVEQGVTLQFHEAAQLFEGGLQHASAVANLDSSFVIAGAPFVNPAEVVGLAAGIGIANAAEAKLATILASFLAQRIAIRLVDVTTGAKSQAITFVQPGNTCRRIRTPNQTLLCDHCHVSIQTNTTAYYRKRPSNPSRDHINNRRLLFMPLGDEHGCRRLRRL